MNLFRKQTNNKNKSEQSVEVRLDRSLSSIGLLKPLAKFFVILAALVSIISCGGGITGQVIGVEPSVVPVSTPGPYARANAYRQAENWSMAIREYSTVIATDPDDQDAYLFRAYLYHQIGNHWPAISDYDKVLELSPSSVAFNNRGDVYRDMGRYEQAISDYIEAIGLNPDYAQAYNSRAIAEKTLGKSADWSEDQACSLDSKYCPTPTPAPTPTPTPAPTPKPHGMQLSVNGTALTPGQTIVNLEYGRVVFNPAPDEFGKYDQDSTITVTAYPTGSKYTVILGGVNRVRGNAGTIAARGTEWSMTASIILPKDVFVGSVPVIPAPTVTAYPTLTVVPKPTPTGPKPTPTPVKKPNLHGRFGGWSGYK